MPFHKDGWLTRMRAVVLCCSLCGVFFSSHSVASPWIEASDQRTRQNLEFLNDAGVISIGLTTWPLMWRDVSLALDPVNRSSLSAAQSRAVNELSFELRYQSSEVIKRSVKVSASNSRAIFNDSAVQGAEKGMLVHRFDADGDRISLRLQGNLVSDPGEDSVETYLDGSYLAGALGNWVFGVGAIDRWWGPSSNTSLILSNNARPVPALQFRSQGEQTFESPWFSWVGPWSFTSFVGRLESDRVIPHAYLTGMRLTVRPIKGLELGASRAMMWGGEGRDGDLTEFFRSLTSQDENTKGGSGNQLGGFDLRYGFSLSDNLSSVVYAQLIGEDEAGFMPSKYLSQFGLESTFALDSSASFLKTFVESVNSAAGSLNDPQYNAAYEHSAYKSGYRFRGRSIGASFDGDARVLSAGIDLNMSDNRSAGVSVSRYELNVDGSPGSNAVSRIAQDLYQVSLSYQCLLLGGRLGLSLSGLSKELETPQPDIERWSFGGTWEYRF